jgi:hypothetical protein
MNSPTLTLLRRLLLTAGGLVAFGVLGMLLAGTASAQTRPPPPINSAVGSLVGSVVAPATDAVTPVTGAATKVVTPVLQPVHDVVDPIVQHTVAPVVHAVTAPVVQAIAPVVHVVRPVLRPLVHAVQPVVHAVEPVVHPVVRAIAPVVTQVVPTRTVALQELSVPDSVRPARPQVALAQVPAPVVVPRPVVHTAPHVVEHVARGSVVDTVVTMGGGHPGVPSSPWLPPNPTTTGSGSDTSAGNNSTSGTAMAVTGNRVAFGATGPQWLLPGNPATPSQDDYRFDRGHPS